MISGVCFNKRAALAGIRPGLAGIRPKWGRGQASTWSLAGLGAELGRDPPSALQTSPLRAFLAQILRKSALYGDPCDNPRRCERFGYKPSLLRALWLQTLGAASVSCADFAKKRSLRGPLRQPSPLRALWLQTLAAGSALATNPRRCERFRRRFREKALSTGTLATSLVAASALATNPELLVPDLNAIAML